MISILETHAAIKTESSKLVELVRTGLPVGSESSRAGHRLTRKSSSVVRQVVGTAVAFTAIRELGLLSRAYLANRVKWGLMDLGYAQEFVDDITASILVASTPSR